MSINYEEIKLILKMYSKGIFLDEILEKLNMDNTNKNRIQVTSILNWKREVKKIYICKYGKIKTKYKLEE